MLQGSVIGITDASGVLQDSHSYSAFGMPGDWSADATGNPLRYTARRWDAESGLYYYRARDYSPALGRFLTTDPIGFGDGLNVYAYVGNDPVNLIDPSGLGAEDNRAGSRFIDSQSYQVVGEITIYRGRPFPGLSPFGGGSPKLNQLGPVRSQAGRNQLQNSTALGSGTVRGVPGIYRPSFKVPSPSAVPPRATSTFAHVSKTGNAPSGFKGGRAFNNDGRGGGQVLPQRDAGGNTIKYREFDVRPYQKGVNRGAERIVVGGGKGYYTNDHYSTFTPIE